jgi:putative ABC transport system permease protein
VYVLLGLIVAFCALALVNAIAMSTGERSRELALLRVVGAERRQLRSMIRAETAIMVAFGVTIGTLVAVPGLVLFSRDVSGGLLPEVSLHLYAGLVGLYTVLAFVATAVPVRLATRVDPVLALGARE